HKGQIQEEMGTHLWFTARLLQVYSVAASMGRPGANEKDDKFHKPKNRAQREKKNGGGYNTGNENCVEDD
ncbi:AGE family epimerase/isomerase, partial [Salmonella enterica]|uniref:AGE family epimerase/isomerase n=1 Tax=Salmonella enterica TaxID=28901 RepID=UPI0032970E12